MTVKDLLTDETRWTQYCLARNDQMDEVHEYSPNAVCWCLKGALLKCYSMELCIEIENRLEYDHGIRNISNWNDTHSFADVRALIEKLDI